MHLQAGGWNISKNELYIQCNNPGCKNKIQLRNGSRGIPEYSFTSTSELCVIIIRGIDMPCCSKTCAKELLER